MIKLLIGYPLPWAFAHIALAILLFGQSQGYSRGDVLIEIYRIRILAFGAALMQLSLAGHQLLRFYQHRGASWHLFGLLGAAGLFIAWHGWTLKESDAENAYRIGQSIEAAAAAPEADAEPEAET
jgi:hypothetical protein